MPTSIDIDPPKIKSLIPYQELELNKIYRIYTLPYYHFRLFKFKVYVVPRHLDYINRWGTYCIANLWLEPKNTDKLFILANKEEIRNFTQARRVFYIKLAERIQREREIELEIRIRRTYLYMNNIDNYNRDVETQLLSESFHKVLTKALDNKVARCLLKINKMGYFDCSTRNVTIRSSDKLMTYRPSGKKTIMTEGGNWEHKGRQDGKYGKVIRKILREQVPRLKYTDSEIEELVNHLKAESADGDFQIVKGEKILDWYNGKCYADEDIIGTLGYSCMREGECRDFMRIYSDNPKQVKMAILTKEGELVGRAIIWDDKWMDRIYGTDSTIKAFRNFAKEKGYYCKATQGSCPEDGWVHPETGDFHEEKVIVSLDIAEFPRYPYADTLCYIDVGNKQVSNSYDSLSNHLEMRGTNGYIEGEDMIYDEYTGEDIHEDDSVYLEHSGYSTHHENARECEIDGYYYLIDETVITWDDRSASEDNVIYVFNESAYATDNEVYTCEQGGEEYIEGLHSSVHIEELGITVMEENVTEAYADADYHNVEGEWKEREELEANGYSEIDGQWIYEKSNDETINV